MTADPQKYRDEGARIRAEAETTIDTEHKAKLLEIASLYQNLAENVADGRKRLSDCSIQTGTLVRQEAGEIQPVKVRPR
jgi:hypothetical protein